MVVALFVLSPTQFPWNYLWLLPSLALNPNAPLVLYTALLIGILPSALLHQPVDDIHFRSRYRMAGTWARTGAADPSVMGEPKRKRHRNGAFSLSPAGGMEVHSGYHTLRLSGSGFHGIPLGFPGGYATFQRLCVAITFCLVCLCQTGRSALVGSRAVKDDLLRLGKGIQFGFEFTAKQRPFEQYGFAFFIPVSADQKGLPGLDLFHCLIRADAIHFSNGLGAARHQGAVESQRDKE